MTSPISTQRGEGIVTKSTHHAFCAECLGIRTIENGHCIQCHSYITSKYQSIEGTNNMFLNKTSDEGFISTTKSRPEPPSPPHRNNNNYVCIEREYDDEQPQNDEDNDVDMDEAIEIISLISDSDDESVQKMMTESNPIVIHDSDDDIDLNRNPNTVLPDFSSPSPSPLPSPSPRRCLPIMTQRINEMKLDVIDISISDDEKEKASGTPYSLYSFVKKMNHYQISISENSTKSYALKKTLQLNRHNRIIIYFNIIKRMDAICDYLKRMKKKVPVFQVHSKMEINQRKLILSKFFNGTGILCCTDVIFDIRLMGTVEMIIHFHLPKKARTYCDRCALVYDGMHKRNSFSLVYKSKRRTHDEHRKIEDLQQKLNIQFKTERRRSKDRYRYYKQ